MNAGVAILQGPCCYCLAIAMPCCFPCACGTCLGGQQLRRAASHPQAWSAFSLCHSAFLDGWALVSFLIYRLSGIFHSEFHSPLPFEEISLFFATIPLGIGWMFLGGSCDIQVAHIQFQHHVVCVTPANNMIRGVPWAQGKMELRSQYLW